jgi:hypothetical protein
MLTPHAKEIIGDRQRGFRRNRSTADRIFCIHEILEKKWEYNEAVLSVFIHFQKDCVSVRSEVLYNILTEFGIPMKLVRLIKMCLTETYSRVRVSKNLTAMFPIRNGLKQGGGGAIDFQLLAYTIRRVQVNKDGLKLNGKHHLLAYADDVNILGGSIHTIQENAGALILASKETALEVNAD